MPDVITTIAGIRDVLAAHRTAGRTIAFTPTMGALHDGHLEHVRRAGAIADVRVVSVFVNPLQFGPGEDLAKYPRTLDDDVAALQAEGVDLVFAPTAEQMYPNGPSRTTVSAGRVGTRYEGAARPGHFDGMLTVVAKLLNILQPDVVTFGQKDAQQLFLVQRMVADLDIPTRIEVVPTVREADGLAMSSRNRYLDPGQRRAARVLSRTLEAAASSADRGVDAAVASAQGALAGEPMVELDYFALMDPATFEPVGDDHHGPVTAIVAARVGTTRLIDTDTLRLP